MAVNLIPLHHSYTFCHLPNAHTFKDIYAACGRLLPVITAPLPPHTPIPNPTHFQTLNTTGIQVFTWSPLRMRCAWPTSSHCTCRSRPSPRISSTVGLTCGEAWDTIAGCVDLLDTAAIKGRGCHIRAGGCLFRCGHRHLRGQERPCMATPFDLLLHTTSPLLPPSLQTMPSPRSIIRPSCIQQRPCHCPFLRLPPHPLPFSPLPCR